jgi:phage protein U
MFGTLIMLGPFRFSLDSAAYDELTTTTSYEWAEQPRIGEAPSLQFTGPAAEQKTLRGRIIPGFTGGVEQLARMRVMAEQGRPLFMVDGVGRVHGNWVITSIADTGTRHFKDGYPRMVTFDLALKKYDDGTGLFGVAGKLSKLISLFG